MLSDGTLARLGRNEGVRKMQTAERAAVVGSPDLESLTTSHVERAFLTVRQELKRFGRKTLGYSKSLEMHKLAVALFLGVYNFARQHHSLGTTPAVAAGLEEKPDLLDNDRVCLIVLMELGVRTHLIEMLLVINRRPDHLARIRNRTEEPHSIQRQRR